MRIYNAKLTGATVGGLFQGNFTHLNCLCQNIIVTPTTPSTTYDVRIMNPDNSVIYERTSETGTLSEVTAIPLLGTYTVSILNATNDENFIICLVSRED